MPHIDLFNKTADFDKLSSNITDGTFKIASKTYAKYALKCAAESLVIGAVATLAFVGALAIIAEAITPTEETE